MGVWSAGAVVAASMIGAGVYTTSGFTLGDLGSPHLVMMAWAVGGLIAICGAICYGALARQFTESGGEYLFLSRAVHPAAGMMAGWVSLLAGFTGALAFAATAFQSVLVEAEFVQTKDLPSNAVAIGLLLIAATIHSVGLQGGTRFQNVVVVFKLSLIALFLLISLLVLPAWAGFSAEVTAGLTDVEFPGEETLDGKARLTGLAFALAFANALTWISLSYSGFNAAVYMTDEIAEPRRNVPRAMLIGTIVVTAIYLVLNFVFVYAPEASSIAGQPNVATIAAAAVGSLLVDRGAAWGMYFESLIQIVILVGLATSTLALTQTGPRVFQKMASDGLLPRSLSGEPGDGPSGQTGGRLSELNDKLRETETLSETTPSETEAFNTKARPALLAIWIQAGLAALVISSASLRSQLDYLGFTLSVCAALCGSLVFWFRNHGEHPVRVWGYPYVPAIYVIGTIGIATLTAVRVPMQAAVGLGTLTVGFFLYLGTRLLWGSRAREDRRN